MGAKEIQKLYETTILNGTSKALEESRGGWMMNMLGDLEEAFNADAGFFNGKYGFGAQRHDADAAKPMLSEKDHKAIIRALMNIVKAMQKGYKGKLIGF